MTVWLVVTNQPREFVDDGVELGMLGVNIDEFADTDFALLDQNPKNQLGKYGRMNSSVIMAHA